MAFSCKDCSYTSKKKFPGGKCPACDSFNVSASHKSNAETDARPKRTLMQVCVMIIVWLAFAYAVWDSYFKKEKVIHPSEAVLETPATSYDPLE